MKNFLRWFLIPLIVGIIVAIIQFGLPYVIKEKKEITYKIFEPISYLDPDKIGTLKIEINGVLSPSLFSNQYTIENTGQIPLREISVLINFNTTDSLFTIYNHSIDTQPKFEFGVINTEIINHNIKFTIELLNPKDKIHFNVLTNLKVPSELFSKSEGMILKQAVDDRPKDDKSSFLIALFASLLSTIMAFFVVGKTITSTKEVKTFIDNLFKAKGTSGLKIISAYYGKNDKYYDITETLNKQLIDNKLVIIATNKIAGDPIPGVPKELNVVYSFNNEIFKTVIPEGKTLSIPEVK
jgi:hypothetical protein